MFINSTKYEVFLIRTGLRFNRHVSPPSQSLKSRRDPFGTDGTSHRRFNTRERNSYYWTGHTTRELNSIAAALRCRSLPVPLFFSGSSGPLERKKIFVLVHMLFAITFRDFIKGQKDEEGFPSNICNVLPIHYFESIAMSMAAN